MAANWLSVWFKWRVLEVISKPAVTLFLVIWLIGGGSLQGSEIWFAAGLSVSALGDALLLFPDFFLYGLIAFVFTHIFYIIGFNQPNLLINIRIYILLLLFASLWGFMYSLVRKTAISKYSNKRNRLAAGIYSLVLCAMMFSASTTIFRDEWPRAAAGLAVSGAALFFFSDALLAVDRFIKPIPLASLWKRITYFLSQLAISTAAYLMFLS